MLRVLEDAKGGGNLVFLIGGRITRDSIDRQRYGYQDKKIMEKQHGVNIMAVEVQIGWLWTWPRGGRESGISQDGNERLPRDAMLHVTSVVNG
ncbi:hypothetical protein Tco_0356515 [Tanacetum coccineum]